jgi:hypothetical protein
MFENGLLPTAAEMRKLQDSGCLHAGQFKGIRTADYLATIIRSSHTMIPAVKLTSGRHIIDHSCGVQYL